MSHSIELIRKLFESEISIWKKIEEEEEKSKNGIASEETQDEWLEAANLPSQQIIELFQIIDEEEENDRRKS